MKQWTFGRREAPPSHRCAKCHQEVLWLDEVGWVDPSLGSTYDMCERDRYANHDAVPTARL